MKNLLVILFLSAFVIFSSCGNKNTKTENNKVKIDSYYVPQYAKGFHLFQSDNGAKILEVNNPWQGASDMQFTYYLKPDADPNKHDEIKIPVTNVICLSTTHIAYVDALGKSATINGVSGASYITNPIVRQGIAEKRVFDVGYETGLNYERIVSLHPDVVFAYGVSGELSNVAAKLNELGVKVVFLGDYLEETALGKTEWLVAVAAFFNEEEMAKKQLTSIFNEYNSLLNKINEQAGDKPKVMLNAPWKDSWFIPGGNSYMVNLIKDAGGNFIFGDNDKRDSYPISIEKAYNETMNADYWLNPNAANSLADVKLEDSRLADVPAFKSHKIYNNNARVTSGGGSDFWESGVMNPHVILKDLVKIFHPQILAEHELVYFHQLR